MFWLLAILAYLLGSLSFAILLSRLAGGPDPRASGSGNPGATNMWRVAGKRLAILTLFGDLLKGLVPILLAAAWAAVNSLWYAADFNRSYRAESAWIIFGVTLVIAAVGPSAGRVRSP